MFTFDDLRTDSQKHAHSIGLLPYWYYDISAMTQFNPPQTTSGQTTQQSHLTIDDYADTKGEENKKTNEHKTELEHQTSWHTAT